MSCVRVGDEFYVIMQCQLWPVALYYKNISTCINSFSHEFNEPISEHHFIQIIYTKKKKKIHYIMESLPNVYVTF